MNYDPDRYAKTAFDVQEPAKRLLNILDHHLKNSKSSDLSELILVDFGCGPGNTVEMLSKKFPNARRIIGVDIDSNMIRYATEHARKTGKSEKFQFFEKDLSAPWSEWPDELTKLEGKVDAIFSNYTLHWLDDRTESMALNVAKLLKPIVGLFVADILYCGDLTKVCQDRQDQLNWLKNKFQLPTESEFISKYLISFRDAGFHTIELKYEDTISNFPEQEYRQNFIKIPIRWYRKHQLPGGEEEDESSESIDTKIKELLLKLRIQRRFVNESGIDMVQLKQILWTVTLFKNGA